MVIGSLSLPSGTAITSWISSQYENNQLELIAEPKCISIQGRDRIISKRGWAAGEPLSGQPTRISSSPLLAGIFRANPTCLPLSITAEPEGQRCTRFQVRAAL